MSEKDVPLYVRLPAEQAQLLNDVSGATGRSKRRLVADAVHEHLSDGGLVVGRVALRENAPQVLTLEEAAALLRVSPEQLRNVADEGGIPGRQIADEWRFARDALLAWLDRKPQPL